MTPWCASSAPSSPEQHDEWIEGRRYLGLDVLAKTRLNLVPEPTATAPEEVPTGDIPALSA